MQRAVCCATIARIGAKEEAYLYIAMNRFQVALGAEDEFEALWRNRDSHLHTVDGFREFKMLRGAPSEECTIYISQSQWESEAAFRAWTKSEAFREAHKGVGDNRALYLGPPKFEGFATLDGI